METGGFMRHEFHKLTRIFYGNAQNLLERCCVPAREYSTEKPTGHFREFVLIRGIRVKEAVLVRAISV